uniref:Uncharacterized protein n=1 Tax=Arundo donax TaxID=35708 RepID=A0A0A8ZDP1_ARUDO
MRTEFRPYLSSLGTYLAASHHQLEKFLATSCGSAAPRPSLCRTKKATHAESFHQLGHTKGRR